MGSDFLDISVNISLIASFLPIVLMLWYFKVLKKRSFGWAIFGYLTTLFLEGSISYITAYLIQTTFPVFHVFTVFESLFIFLLFKNEYTNAKFKIISIIFFALTLLTEIVEFNFKGGFLENNEITFSVINLSFIIQYFLYLIDSIKNKPAIIFDRKGPFLIFSATLFYTINQLLFSLIQEDIRQLINNDYAYLIWVIFAWLYTLYLLIASLLLWRNLRS